MNENEFANIEYSKQLSDMFQDADWWWIMSVNNMGKYELVTKNTLSLIQSYHDNIHKSSYIPSYLPTCKIYYPAITIQMALVQLPIKMEHHDGWWNLKISRYGNNEFHVYYSMNYSSVSHKSLPNALCKMIIKLKEEGIIEKTSDCKCEMEEE